MKAPCAAAALYLFGLTFAGCRQKAPELRLVEPRLADGAAYAPCLPGTEPPGLIPPAICGGAHSGERKARPAGEEPAVRGEREPDIPETKGTRTGDLLKNGGVDSVLRELERSLGGDPHNARTWSNLAAAYLVRAQQADDPRDLLRAYGAADRAVKENGSLPEARFNRALSLQRLFLAPQAVEAWKDYLDLDPRSGWAAEAEKHRADLDQPLARSLWEEKKRQLDRAALAGDAKTVETIVDSYRQAAREYAEQELFGLWASAVQEGRENLAADRLRVLRSVGETLARVSGEPLVRDAVARIDALAAGPPEPWRGLVQGVRDFRAGFLAYRARDCKEAVPELTAARGALERSGSPLAVRANLYIVGCDFITRHFGPALHEAERLVKATEAMPYPSLRGHALRVKGAAEVTLGSIEASIADYDKSLSEFERLREDENWSAVAVLRGESLNLLGRRRESWLAIYQALRATPRLRDTGALANAFKIAADAALRDGEGEAALAFERERLRHALESNSLAAVEALTGLARMQDLEGGESALAILQEARRRADLLSDPRQRRRSLADLGMIEGTLVAQEDPRRAVDLLTSALEVYEEDRSRFLSLWAFLARGRAQRALGDAAGAEQDFEKALDIYRGMGKQLDQEGFRLALLEETDEVFDELVSLQADRDPDRAFSSADRALSRVLPGSASRFWSGAPGELSRLRAEEPRPLSLDEISRRLPAGTTLVQFSVLEDRLLIWRLRQNGGGRRFFVRTFPRKRLEPLVARLQRFRQPDWNEASVAVFDLLVRPWLDAAPPGERIVLVPDKVLNRVPFAALRERPNGPFLIERNPLAVAPSATLYINALGRQSRMKWTARSPGLVIGEPAIDHTLFYDLASLPASASEASVLARRTRSILLGGRDAVKSAFLDQAPRSEWIHFSGHSLVDPRNTLLSKLVLAPETEGDPGVLTAQEIYSLDLGRTGLVVLAACETGNEYIPGSEGVTSLARAFLAAGAPTVVASLWSVDDRATADLFDSFYQFLLGGDDPVDALRKAQLGMLRGGNTADRPPQAWAAFEVIGASAE